MPNSHKILMLSGRRLSGRQISELLGLCRGLIADGKINQTEAEALHTWLINQDGIGHPLVKDLRIRVERMLEDGVLDADESAELMDLVRALIDRHELEAGIALRKDGTPANRLDDCQLSVLVGLCRGLIADGKINQNEAATLDTWIRAHEGAIASPVLQAFQDKIKPHLHNQAASPEQNTELLQLLSGLVGGKSEVGECLQATTLWLDEPAPQILFDRRRFCLTGKFLHGNRGKCENEVQVRGGTCQSLPSEATDYVVIGSYAEGAWIQSAFGRKIERAVELRTDGHSVKIVSETHWVASLDS